MPIISLLFGLLAIVVAFNLVINKLDSKLTNIESKVLNMQYLTMITLLREKLKVNLAIYVKVTDIESNILNYYNAHNITDKMKFIMELIMMLRQVRNK